VYGYKELTREGGMTRSYFRKTENKRRREFF